jgi:hypothetical protein
MYKHIKIAKVLSYAIGTSLAARLMCVLGMPVRAHWVRSYGSQS